MDSSKADARLTQEGTIQGPPAFMSPEQAVADDLELRLAHISEPAVFPDQSTIAVPRDLQSVVLRCLEKDPARRFQSADRLSQALADCTTNP
jgi:eukaryotic-like serine/threonine-protein kinase